MLKSDPTEGTASRQARPWNLYGRSNPRSHSREQDRAHFAIFIVAAGFHLFRSAAGAYLENGDNCQMQLRR